MIGLPYAEESMTIRKAVSNVTDRQMDGQTDRRAYRWVACRRGAGQRAQGSGPSYPHYRGHSTLWAVFLWHWCHLLAAL